MNAVQKIAVKSVEESLNFLKEGITEIGFEKKVSDLMKSNGMDKIWYPTRVYFSHRTMITSKKILSSDTKLRKGDIVSVKVHPAKDNYMGDYSITTVFGNNPEVEEFVENAKEIEEKTIKFATAKTTGRELFNYSLGLIREFGYILLDLRGNIGHNVGRLPADGSKFERTFLDQQNNEPLEGKFWTIEPFMGNGGFGAVFEDLVFIGENEKKIIRGL
jgi:Xaa-Pro aminopeptidase